MMIGTLDCFRSARVTSRPSICGSPRSRTTRSGWLRARERQRIGAVAGGHDIESRALEIIARDLRNPRLVVHDQDVLHVVRSAARGGRSRVRAAMPFVERRHRQ